MKPKIIICLLFLIVKQLSFGQNKVADSCDLKTKNTQWKTSFETAKSDELKIKLIREKIISDSIYSEYKPKVNIRCGPTIYSETVDVNGNNCGVKMLFALNYTKKKSIILNLNRNPEYLFIVQNLNEINIDKIYPVFGNDAKALYGSYGTSGAVILKTENKKFIKEIETYIKKVEKNKIDSKKPNG
jgi:hypothetical protein